jgi:hypothetical protein
MNSPQSYLYRAFKDINRQYIRDAMRIITERRHNKEQSARQLTILSSAKHATRRSYQAPAHKPRIYRTGDRKQ